jgi:hypothetical protein
MQSFAASSHCVFRVSVGQFDASRKGTRVGDSFVKPSSVRRKIVKGTLAAPVVMTVSSAQAARTSFTACLSNGAGDPTPGRVLSTSRYSDDSWLRVQVNIYKVKTPNSSGVLVERDGLYFVGPDKRTFFKLANYSSESIPATQVSDFNAYTGGLQKSVVDRRYALAYVSDGGDVVGYAWQKNGGTHCKKSCYSSVIAQSGRRRWI